jgi:uncharacterized membrane-anchored protein
MNHTLRSVVVLGNVLLVLACIAFLVIAKERLRIYGELALFELVPVDPRSLMQGDYMALRYAVTREGFLSEPRRGVMVFTMDTNRVAHFVRAQKAAAPLRENERCIKYFSRRNGVSIGAESFFFQEGYAELFAAARYGGIRVGEDGDKMLVGLYDSAYTEIIPKERTND